MSYMEIIKRALKNRSVNAASKEWGVPQRTLNDYAKGKTVPDPITTDIMMKEAGVSAEEMHNALVELERQRRATLDKIAKSFKFLLRAASAGFQKEFSAA